MNWLLFYVGAALANSIAFFAGLMGMALFT